MSKNSKRKARRARQAAGGGQVAASWNAKLTLWKGRLSKSDEGYADEKAKMDHREALYRGDDSLKPMVKGDKNDEKTCHVRNIIFENVESQISSNFPKPKVTPRRKKDEPLANKIEHFLRNELERMDFECLNDMAERTVPIQGGVGFLVEWDTTKRTHFSAGQVCVSMVHPKQFAPQPGIYTSVKDMDWFIIKVPTTKEEVWRQYGKSVYAEGESEPEIRAAGEEDHSDDTVTMYIGFEKGENGAINKYVWVNDVELEDLENYQARRQPVCCRCGRVRPLAGQMILSNIPCDIPDVAGEINQDVVNREAAGHELAAKIAMQVAMNDGNVSALAGVDMVADIPEQRVYDGGACPWCGCEEFDDQEQEYEQIMLPIQTVTGENIPGAELGFDEMGQPVMKPTMVPFYKPDVYPIVLQKSVSVYGQLLGNSDVDAIEDQQNTINRLEKRIIERLLMAGTRITLPDRTDLRIDPTNSEIWYIGKQVDKNLIDVYDFSGNLQYEIAYLAMVYEESRQILGITDSFQGRRDPTATSGVAKERSAAQAAGRLESKRIMKNAAYAVIFELIFKNWLAYSDEPRPVSFKDIEGQTQYEEISRYDFLEKDPAGNWVWNDQFLFSCDNTAPLASNREAMWQETRMNLQTGAFGDPTQTDTLILFWTKMEELHYPGAASTKQHLEVRRKKEQEMQMKMMRMQYPQPGGMPGNGQMVSPAMGG